MEENPDIFLRFFFLLTIRKGVELSG